MTLVSEDCTGMTLLASEDTGDYDDHDDHDDQDDHESWRDDHKMDENE